MSEGRRPGGLTVLAVINFVLGGIYVLGLFGILFAAVAARKSDDPDLQVLRDHPEYLWLGGAQCAIAAALLITSGVGYLKLKKVLGRYVGNVYALLVLVLAAVAIALGQEFGIGTLVGLIYPVLTLALLNTTFREDFVN